MKRKLVKQGAATMMVSLPSRWIKENRLGKGDEIDMETAGRGLLISSDAAKAKAETEIVLTGLTESLIRTMIGNSYRMGYDKVKVNFGSDRQFKILQETIKENLLGFDIIKKEKDFCIIESITEPSIEQFDNIIQKIFYNSLALFEITEKRLKNGKADENYEDVETRITQYDNFCRRVMAKKGFEKNAQLFWAFLTAINHGQRELYHLNIYLDSKKAKKNDSILEILDDSKELFKAIVACYEKKDKSLLENIFSKEKEIIYKKGYKALEKDSIIAFHLLSSARNFYLAASPLSGLIF